MDVPATSGSLDAINAARRVARRAALLKRARGGGWRDRITVLLPMATLGAFAVAKLDDPSLSITCVIGMVAWAGMTLERIFDSRVAALLELMSLGSE